MFNHLLGNDNYGKIFCSQGELFRVPELRKRTSEYLNYVKSAGTEYVKGNISDSTREHLNTLLFPKETFEAMADASWGIEKAFENPLFIKTNAILTLMWGILYVLTSIMTYFVMKTNLSTYLGIINNILPILMGIFTVWFQKWYPAKVARGK